MFKFLCLCSIPGAHQAIAPFPFSAQTSANFASLAGFAASALQDLHGDQPNGFIGLNES
jgi:hypothetical protein